MLEGPLGAQRPLGGPGRPVDVRVFRRHFARVRQVRRRVAGGRLAAVAPIRLLQEPPIGETVD